MRRTRAARPVRTTTRKAALAGLAAGALVLASALGAVPARAAATPTTYTIGVGGAPPAGHPLEYTDFFPRSGINVHNGDVIDFSIPAGASPDDSHIVAVLKQGVTVAQAMSDPANALIIPDTDENGSPQENVAVFGGSSPPPGSGAPGACGDKTTPCSYDGTSELISGQVPGPGSDYVVKLALPAGFTGTVTAVDLGHPIKDPSAAITVVADSATASAQSDLNQAAAAQYQSDTSEALSAEAAANHDTVTTNANGTHTHTVNVGVATQYTELMEFLPGTVHVAPGDSADFVYKGISNPHTVTFPGNGLAAGTLPFPFQANCEGPGGDTLASPTASPPDFGCAGGPSAAELPFKPQSFGSATIRAAGYRLVSAGGGLFDFGQAAYHGSAGGLHLRAPVVATASSADQGGYYEVTSAGGIFTFGDAGYFGSMAGKALKAPVVGMIVSPDNGGYVLVAADGELFPFGDVPPVSLPSGTHLASPVVGAAVAINSGQNGPPGFYLATASGGVITIAGAPFFGSLGGKHLASPIVGIVDTPDGGGYWLVSANGGVFSFGDAGYYGSTGGRRLVSPVKGMTVTPSGLGYWLVAADGGVFSFGDAGFYGSMGGRKLNSPIVGIDSAFNQSSSGVLINVPAGNPNDLPSRTSYTYTFPDKGTYSYLCWFHQMMTGTVVVG